LYSPLRKSGSFPSLFINTWVASWTRVFAINLPSLWFSNRVLVLIAMPLPFRAHAILVTGEESRYRGIFSKGTSGFIAWTLSIYSLEF